MSAPQAVERPAAVRCPTHDSEVDLLEGLMKRFRHLNSRRCGVAVLASGVLLATPAIATADRIAPIKFEPPTYTLGNINGQNNWMKTGLYDSEVAPVSSFPAAAGYRFGTQALRMSNAFADGAFGGQTFSPGLASPAGELALNRHFEARFRIGTTKAVHQPNLRLSVSPDDGNGSRMSFLRFEDLADGVHVFFADVANAGPLGTVSTFNTTDIATLSRTRAHKVRFSLELKPGLANDVARIYIDGKLKRLADPCSTGTTWEDYYRFDPEQNTVNPLHIVPTISKLLFHVRGDSNPSSAGQGFLVDKVSLRSSLRPTHKRDCKVDHGKSKGDDHGKSKGDDPGKSKGDDHGKSKGDDPGKSKGDDPGKSKGDDPGKSKGDDPGKSKGDDHGKHQGDDHGKHQGDDWGKHRGHDRGERRGKH
jgi:hypothetical protein